MGRKIKYEFEAEIFNIDELNEIETILVCKAKEALNNAYAPYSDFFVGAAVLLEDGSIVLGSNQENAAYPSGLCAERVALFHIGANYPGKVILKIAVAAKPKNAIEYVQAGPCGSCRQVIFEYRNNQKQPINLLLVQPDNEVIKTEVNDLLPFAFGKNSLLK
ncbi:cytidine deaminase [Reichenbachiella sp. MALMAid0571]|uniref:cytidine deaminase n=1 Tax=Reichenbachiella sp. MALMAid0571 TaxID=3143939 RepID=UPI0032DF2293